MRPLAASVRDAGLKRLSVVTRCVVAGAVVLTGGVSAFVAQAKPGHAKGRPASSAESRQGQAARMAPSASRPRPRSHPRAVDPPAGGTDSQTDPGLQPPARAPRPAPAPTPAPSPSAATGSAGGGGAVSGGS